MPQNKYTYEDAGFNGFLSRSLKSNPGVNRLAGRPSVGSPAMINFDMLNSSGAIADNLRIGSRLELQGNKGRIAFKDNQSTEVGWAGDLET